jgi:hypothetical protein
VLKPQCTGAELALAVLAYNFRRALSARNQHNEAALAGPTGLIGIRLRSSLNPKDPEQKAPDHSGAFYLLGAAIFTQTPGAPFAWR